MTNHELCEGIHLLPVQKSKGAKTDEEMSADEQKPPPSHPVAVSVVSAAENIHL